MFIYKYIYILKDWKIIFRVKAFGLRRQTVSPWFNVTDFSFVYMAGDFAKIALLLTLLQEFLCLHIHVQLLADCMEEEASE